MASVSFPAIGTGNLGFPKNLVANVMLSEVQEFTPQNLKEITVIVHPSDKESLDVSVFTENCFKFTLVHKPLMQSYVANVCLY